MNVLTSMPMKGKLMLAGSVLATVVVVFLLFRMATAPSYTTLVSGVKAGQTGKVTAALDEAGIPYRIRPNGSGVDVPTEQVAQAKVTLAGSGVDVSGAEQPGYELLDNQKLGSSNLQQKVAYQRAKEGEIANTVGSMSGIAGATVQLSLPEDQLFADDTKPATAGVVLDVAPGGIEQQQVRGIANLVASSVEGLKDENVTITASSGELLWPADANGQPGGSTAKIAAENRYASQMESDLNQMLVRTLGPEKAYVEVRPTLNVDEVSREELRYGDRGTALSRKSESETLQTEGDAAATAGARANIGETGVNGAGGRSDYERDMREESFGVGKTVERTKVAPGAVERLDVALVLDDKLPAAQVAEIESAVQAAAGINAQRGDQLNVSQVPFAKPEVPKAPKPPVPPQAIGAAKWVGLGIAAALFLFFVTRSLRRREGEILGEAKWLTEIDEPRPLNALTGGGADGEGGNDQPEIKPSAARMAVTETVDKEPEKVAQQVRAWMAEEM